MPPTQQHELSQGRRRQTRLDDGSHACKHGGRYDMIAVDRALRARVMQMVNDQRDSIGIVENRPELGYSLLQTLIIERIQWAAAPASGGLAWPGILSPGGAGLMVSLL